MKNWLRNQDIEMLTEWLESLSVPLLICDGDRKIVWANSCFGEMSGYSSWEIKNKVYYNTISSDKDNEQADEEMLVQCKNGDILTFNIKKQISPKNGAPLWVDVDVFRYPQVGQFQFLLITIQPIKTDSNVAFSMAIDSINDFSKHLKDNIIGIQEMENNIVSKLTEIARPQNETEQIALSVGRLIFKYPKVSAIIGLTILIMILGNQFAEAIKNVKSIVGF